MQKAKQSKNHQLLVGIASKLYIPTIKPPDSTMHFKRREGYG